MLAEQTKRLFNFRNNTRTTNNATVHIISVSSLFYHSSNFIEFLLVLNLNKKEIFFYRQNLQVSHHLKLHENRSMTMDQWHSLTVTTSWTEELFIPVHLSRSLDVETQKTDDILLSYWRVINWLHWHELVDKSENLQLRLCL